jgi:hypothetical protein
MTDKIEVAIRNAAEAAMAHMILISKTVNAKLISEGAVYETIANGLRSTATAWVNHEHKISLPHKTKTKIGPGDHKRVDFAIEYKAKVYLLETKIASRNESRSTVNVTEDIEKLRYGQHANPSSKPIAEHAYLIVLNLRNDVSDDDGYGHITWGEPLEEGVVTCINTFAYKTKGFVRTASVFRITR